MVGLGVFRCKNCAAAYTKKELEQNKNVCKKCKKKSFSEVQSKENHTIKLEQWNSGVEKWYFWILDFLKENLFFTDVDKISDVYTATEASDFWATIEQRKQAQADKASQYLATIGNMTKNLFQLLRELRIMDERLDYYKGVSNGVHASDIALKGIWIDLVEGGAQKPTSIYGMATQVGFTTLPDYFFELFVKPIKNEKGDVDIDKTLASVDKIVGGLKEEGLNRKMREVLSRKLQEYIAWRERTRKEMTVGKKFKLRYLRQHFHTIRLYMSWARPYLQNVTRLNMPISEESDRTAWTETLRASEGAVIDVELFAVKPKKTTPLAHEVTDKLFEFYFPCQRIIFHYRTKPEMLYRQEWQKGAVHVGFTEISFQSTAMSKEEIDKYKKRQVEDDIELLKHLNLALVALEDELINYLKEADDEWAKEMEEAKKKEGLKPNALSWLFKKKEPLISAHKKKQYLKDTEGQAKEASKTIFLIIRKAHGMITPGD